MQYSGIFLTTHGHAILSGLHKCSQVKYWYDNIDKAPHDKQWKSSYVNCYEAELYRACLILLQTWTEQTPSPHASLEARDLNNMNNDNHNDESADDIDLGMNGVIESDIRIFDCANREIVSFLNNKVSINVISPKTDVNSNLYSKRAALVYIGDKYEITEHSRSQWPDSFSVTIKDLRKEGGELVCVPTGVCDSNEIIIKKMQMDDMKFQLKEYDTVGRRFSDYTNDSIVFIPSKCRYGICKINNHNQQIEIYDEDYQEIVLEQDDWDDICIILSPRNDKILPYLSFVNYNGVSLYKNEVHVGDKAINISEQRGIVCQVSENNIEIIVNKSEEHKFINLHSENSFEWRFTQRAPTAAINLNVHVNKSGDYQRRNNEFDELTFQNFVQILLTGDRSKMVIDNEEWLALTDQKDKQNSEQYPLPDGAKIYQFAIEAYKLWDYNKDFSRLTDLNFTSIEDLSQAVETLNFRHIMPALKIEIVNDEMNWMDEKLEYLRKEFVNSERLKTFINYCNADYDVKIESQEETIHKNELLYIASQLEAKDTKSIMGSINRCVSNIDRIRSTHELLHSMDNQKMYSKDNGYDIGLYLFSIASQVQIPLYCRMTHLNDKKYGVFDNLEESNNKYYKIILPVSVIEWNFNKICVYFANIKELIHKLMQSVSKWTSITTTTWDLLILNNIEELTVIMIEFLYLKYLFEEIYSNKSKYILTVSEWLKWFIKHKLYVKGSIQQMLESFYMTDDSPACKLRMNHEHTHAVKVEKRITRIKREEIMHMKREGNIKRQRMKINVNIDPMSGEDSDCKFGGMVQGTQVVENASDIYLKYDKFENAYKNVPNVELIKKTFQEIDLMGVDVDQAESNARSRSLSRLWYKLLPDWDDESCQSLEKAIHLRIQVPSKQNIQNAENMRQWWILAILIVMLEWITLRFSEIWDDELPTDDFIRELVEKLKKNQYDIGSQDLFDICKAESSRNPASWCNKIEKIDKERKDAKFDEYWTYNKTGQVQLLKKKFKMKLKRKKPKKKKNKEKEKEKSPEKEKEKLPAKEKKKKKKKQKKNQLKKQKKNQLKKQKKNHLQKKIRIKKKRKRNIKRTL